jgi:hypothetical protein
MRSLHMNLKVNNKSFFVKGHERHVQQIGHRALPFFRCEMSARCAPCSTAEPRSGDSVLPKRCSETCGAVSTDVELLSAEATSRRGASDGSARISIVAAGERDAAIPSMPTLSRRASLRKPLDVNFKRCNFARRRARPNLARRISLPVCNESARLCMTVCAARRSQITRVKFIPKASRNQQSIIPQIPTWRWICPKH